MHLYTLINNFDIPLVENFRLRMFSGFSPCCPVCFGRLRSQYTDNVQRNLYRSSKIDRQYLYEVLDLFEGNNERGFVSNTVKTFKRTSIQCFGTIAYRAVVSSLLAVADRTSPFDMGPQQHHSTRTCNQHSNHSTASFLLSRRSNRGKYSG